MMHTNDFLSQIIHVKIDRPLGSRHPQHGFVYPVNYGDVPDTLAPNGEPIDAYVLGVFDYSALVGQAEHCKACVANLPNRSSTCRALSKSPSCSWT